MNGTRLAHPERFWVKVEKTESCWLWTGALRYGYGAYRLNDKAVLAHRAAYEMLVGPIPQGLHLDHVCHNEDASCLSVADCLHRRCVNPAHLRPATHAENVQAGHVGSMNAARILAQTKCQRGHDLTPENVRLTREGWRRCRLCERVRGGYAGAARRIQPDEVDEIRRWLALGETQENVARKVGVAISTIWRLRKAGRL